MKDNHCNPNKCMNLTKKNKSLNKSKHKSLIPSSIISTNNNMKYSSYFQSPLKDEDINLIKKKLQNHSKKSNNNSNKKNNNNSSSKMPISSYITYITPVNNYMIKKKKDNSSNKIIKNNLMLTSINNSSVVHSKDKGLSYSINNVSNNNNLIYKKNSKKTNTKKKISSSNPKRISNNSDFNNIEINNINNEVANLKKNIVAKFNMIKKKDKKYVLTSANSRKNSVTKENEELIKKLHKLNFSLLLNGNNNENKIICSSKGSNNNSNINNSNLYSKLNKSNKNFFIVDMNKKHKHTNHFLESFTKKPQSSNQNKKTTSNNQKNKNIAHLFDNNNSQQQETFYKTAKISPRSSFQNKKQNYVQSHRINMKNKISGNILALYKNKNIIGGNEKCHGGDSAENTNNKNNNIYNNEYNTKIKCNNYIYNNYNNFVQKKNNSKNNHNSNNILNYSGKMISNANFSKCSSSLLKIKNKQNIIYNYNKNKMNNNNSNLENPVNQCQININNISYNNFNYFNAASNNNNLTNNEKILNLFKKQNLINNVNGKFNKKFSQSQKELADIKNEKENRYRTSKNSPNIIKNNSKPKNINNNKSSTSINNYSSSNNYICNSQTRFNDNNILHIKKLISQVKNKINSNYKNTKITKSSNNLNQNKINNSLNKENNDKENNDDTSINKILELKQNLSNEKINKNNIKTISCTSSLSKDSNYYMEKCKKLIKYIHEYYNKNKKYPQTNLSFYLYGRLIGQGAFGKVNIGLNVLTGRVVAIKSFNKKTLDKNDENMKKIIYETNLMKKLNHPNITKILEMFEDENYYLIAMEYINGGNLFSFVKKRRKLSEKTAKFLFRQIILGIKHIHSQKIVHRDIKLENILIDLNNNIKICDFGIGRILNSDNQLLHDKCGTPMYMAPEILLCSKNKGYEGFPVDIWSSGISLYIMLSGTLPFNLKEEKSSTINDENNKSELQYSIINKEPKFIEKISDEARDLLKGLLNKNPNERLTCDEILNHPWLKMDNNKKYHLFTKAEIIMMSKTYIDYRKSNLDDLKENFTISNLKNDDKNNLNKKKLKNVTTKSSLLAPYNTLINDEDSFNDLEIRYSFADMNNCNINLENDIISFNNKVKEFNLNYELNNNGEVDNGILIDTKSDSISLSRTNNSNISILTNNENILGEIEEFDTKKEDNEKKIKKILNEIEMMGFDREYVLDCVNNNILCHASTIYYLMMNYENI